MDALLSLPGLSDTPDSPESGITRQAALTATAAANGKRQRPATAHNTRTILRNLGYARPEKQTVGISPRSAATDAAESSVAGIGRLLPITPGAPPE
jgi:hypothetical protein